MCGHGHDDAVRVAVPRQGRYEHRNTLETHRVEREAARTNRGDTGLVSRLDVLLVAYDILLVVRVHHRAQRLMVRGEEKKRDAVDRLGGSREDGDLLPSTLVRPGNREEDLGSTAPADDRFLLLPSVRRPARLLHVGEETLGVGLDVHTPPWDLLPFERPGAVGTDGRGVSHGEVLAAALAVEGGPPEAVQVVLREKLEEDPLREAVVVGVAGHRQRSVVVADGEPRLEPSQRLPVALLDGAPGAHETLQGVRDEWPLAQVALET